MGLFSKLKDYNLELEEILDNKYFSSNIKSLLLNMVYKLEISYEDYIKVKRCVRSKEDFLNEFIEIIRLYCDNVKVAEPDSDQAKMLVKNKTRALTNEIERSILTYPTEIDLLYALSDISPKYFYMEDDFALKNLVQNVLVNGFNINNVEILKDFNGWSWDSKFDENFNFVDNLIYINLLMILGERFLYEWRTYGSTRKDFLGEVKKYIKSFTGNDIFYNYLLKTIFYFSDEVSKNESDILLKNDLKLLKKMNNRAEFVEDLKNKKIKLSNKLKKIEIALNDKNLLANELKKANSKLDEKKQIKSLNKYKQIVIKEKDNLLKELSKTNEMLKPTNFVEKKHRLESELAFLNIKEKDTKLLISLQLEFLNFIEKKLNKMQRRDEILDIVYIIRYYSNLHLSNNVILSDIDEISDKIDIILKKAITMLCKIGAIKIVSMDINLNFEIIKYAIDTKIIDLEEIKLCIVKEENGIMIKIFDKDVFEKQGRKQLEFTKKTLAIKENKKIKLFN